MAGAYWGEYFSPEATSGLLNIFLACVALGAVVVTTVTLIQLLRGKTTTWKNYGAALLIFPVVLYAFLFLLFLMASPAIAVWYFFFR